MVPSETTSKRLESVVVERPQPHKGLIDHGLHQMGLNLRYSSVVNLLVRLLGGPSTADPKERCKHMGYAVKEIYYTLEGGQTGRPAVFCRFAGCNLWSGREQDRSTAVCRFCDTDFVDVDGPGGGRFEDARSLAAAIATTWPGPAQVDRRFVVCTGGEPLLQMDERLVAELHDWGFEVAVETNGTRTPPPGIDWLCVSPKAGAECLVRSGDELKLVYPQQGLAPEEVADWSFDYFYLQPMDGPQREANTELAVRYCLEHPQWRLSLQTHKWLGLP
jgi:7-carboxy-7-deazaguanine synthase